MIRQITENIVGSMLTVTVICNLREYASNPIKVLTTSDLIDRISSKYDIKKIIKEPNAKIGNSKRRDIKQEGVWVFEIKTTNTTQETKVESKTKSNNTRKRPATKRSTPTKKQESKASIRGRISKLATKKD